MSAQNPPADRTVVLPPRLLRAGRWFSGGLAAWLPALPLVTLATLFLLAPAVQLLVQSLVVDGSFTLDLWQKTLENPTDRDAIATSLRLAAVCATISMTVGAPVAWFISRMVPASRSTWLGLLNIAANFSGIGLGFAYIAALGRVGMIPLGLESLGIDWDAPSPGSFNGLLLAYLYTNIPLYVLLTIPAMGIVRNDWWEAAETSKATRWQFWRHVGLPVLAPFTLAGWLLIFTWTIGIYGIAFALSGNTGIASTRLITLQIGVTLEGLFGRERAAVLAVLLIGMAITSLTAYRFLLKRALRWF